jgi:hypothetical protein
MGFLDRVKKLFGGDAEDEDELGSEAVGTVGAEAPRRDAPRAGDDKTDKNDKRAALRRDRHGGRERPPLADAPPPSQSIEDALVEREAGRPGEARKILIEIDRGGGLRTILRAAAALEANDEREVTELLPTIAREEPRWRLLLQVAGALGDPERAKPYLERASREGAPAWALAWSKAMANDEAARREGLVELLYADASLARTVAARDIKIEGAVADPEAAARYAAFAHGRDSIRRFGAAIVAQLMDRARAAGGP